MKSMPGESTSRSQGSELWSERRTVAAIGSTATTVAKTTLMPRLARPS